MTLASDVTLFLSVLTVLSQLMVLSIVTSVLFKSERLGKLLEMFRRKAIKICLVVALVAMLGSLFYSEVAGYEPCKLCWYQRILMYPLVAIFGVALWKKDNSVSKYVIPLAFLGILIAGYHYYIQSGGTAFASCDAANSCARRFTFTFGYITIPMMALSAFALILALMMIIRKKD
jgi:disulfide bond formation protein DsbB